MLFTFPTGLPRFARNDRFFPIGFSKGGYVATTTGDRKGRPYKICNDR